MNGLCGWVDASTAVDVAPNAISTMAARLDRFEAGTLRTAVLRSGALAATGPDTDAFQGGGRIAAVCGRPRFADAELAVMAQREGIARAVAEGYARKGTAMLASISGTFAIAIIDGERGETLLATDRMGTQPLCHADLGGVLVFASTLDAISAYPGMPCQLDRQAIYDYIYFHMIPGPRTVRAGYSRLRPGTFLSRNGSSSENRPYWEMRYVEDQRGSFPELREAFLSCLQNCVRRAAADGPVGTFLSGGTDSSTVAGMLGQVTGEPARTYSIGFEAQGYDEMVYARIAARHFGTRHHEYYVTPADVVAAIPQIAAAHDQPFGNSSAVPTYYCAKLAKEDGVSVLLGGDGGDELFGGNDRYAKQHLYSLYSDLPAALRKGLIEPIAFLPPEFSIVGKVQRYIRNASVPMPARYDNYNLLERLGPGNVFTDEFLGGVDQDLPRRQMDREYHAAHARSLINRMLAFDLKYTLADNDLPKVSRSCELAGVSIRYPLLDDAVVAFSAHLPPRMKLRGTKLRWFFKEALRGFLPDAIITKTKHGFGLPFGPWLQSHPPLRQIAMDSLADLKRRSIVRPGLIDELTGVHLREHTGYYGTMVWVLMMLEQWIREHKAPA